MVSVGLEQELRVRVTVTVRVTLKVRVRDRVRDRVGDRVRVRGRVRAWAWACARGNSTTSCAWSICSAKGLMPALLGPLGFHQDTCSG